MFLGDFVFAYRGFCPDGPERVVGGGGRVLPAAGAFNIGKACWVGVRWLWGFKDEFDER